MKLINETLSGLNLGQPCTFLNLTLFPLVGSGRCEPDYITLRKAVGDKTVTIREVSEGGSVPVLELVNAGKRPVLIVDGEELVGAKQNRTANVTILAPAGKTLRVPVTCVEAGRWSYTSRSFNPSDQVHFSTGRKRRMASVTWSARATGTRDADQSDVWGAIDEKCMSMGVKSPTSAMSSVFETYKHRVDDYVKAFGVHPGQVGAVFAINERIEGVELFDAEGTFAELLPKLVRSYAIDAIESLKDHRRNPDADDARRFVERVAGANGESYPGIGIGTDVRLTGDSVIAGGLVADERVVHLAAFASDTASRGDAEDRGMLSGLVSRLRDRKRRLKS